jgi:hypothetical protein
MFIEITEKMHKEGYTFTWEQVQGRWKTLVTALKKTKDHNNKSGNDRKTCAFDFFLPWFSFQLLIIWLPLHSKITAEQKLMVQIQKVAVTQEGLVPLFQINASHFLWIKKVRIKQVLYMYLCTYAFFTNLVISR